MDPQLTGMAGVFQIDDFTRNSEKCSTWEVTRRRKVMKRVLKELGQYLAAIERAVQLGLPLREAPKEGQKITEHLAVVRDRAAPPLPRLPNGYGVFQTHWGVGGHYHTFIYGSKYVQRFFSTKEFALHLYWLRQGMQKPCNCFRCSEDCKL